MHKLILTIFSVSVILLASPVLAQKAPQDQPKPQDKVLKAASMQRKISKTLNVEYLLFLPQGYNQKADKKWPLILFLHGAGERGTNIWRVNFHGPSKYIVDHPDFPFIMVSPLCPAGEIWSNEALMALLDETEKKYKVDTTRVYLTGLSMGGFGTWELGTTYPERFAAMAPICGGGRTITVLLAAKGYAPEKLQALRTLGVWVFHGGKDTVVPPEESDRMIEALKAAKVEEIRFTLYPEKQHDSWTETYANPDLYSWFLEHQREPAVAKK